MTNPINEGPETCIQISRTVCDKCRDKVLEQIGHVRETFEMVSYRGSNPTEVARHNAELKGALDACGIVTNLVKWA